MIKLIEWKGKKDEIQIFVCDWCQGTINGKTMEQDDFIIVDDGADLDLQPHQNDKLDVFAFTVPAKTDYATYSQRMRLKRPLNLKEVLH